jgi:hypothetical protein
LISPQLHLTTTSRSSAGSAAAWITLLQAPQR